MLSEFRTLNLGWDPKKPLILEDYTPILALMKPEETYIDSELNHGRLAMVRSE
jgi:hypothetical protein